MRFPCVVGVAREARDGAPAAKRDSVWCWAGAPFAGFDAASWLVISTPWQKWQNWQGWQGRYSQASASAAADYREPASASAGSRCSATGVQAGADAALAARSRAGIA